MTAWGLLAAAALAAGAEAAESPQADEAALRVAVGPVEGAPGSATDVVVRALRALPSVEVVDLRGLAPTLGPAALARLLACEDDPCRVEAASVLPWDRLVVSEVTPDGEILRMRLLTSDPEEPARVRVSRGIGGAGLDAALGAAIRELFPVRAARSASLVEVEGLPPEAVVRFDDGPPIALGPGGGRLGVRLPPGRHEVEARAPGHEPWSERFEVRVGAPVRLEAGLAKRRSVAPWIVGGSGIALAVAGGALTALAQVRADDWASACAGEAACAPGFTRARYLEDEDALALERDAGLVLLGVGATAVLAGVLWFFLDPGRGGPEPSEAPGEEEDPATAARGGRGGRLTLGTTGLGFRF